MYSINLSILRWCEVILPQKAGSLYKILLKKNHFFVKSITTIIIYVCASVTQKQRLDAYALSIDIEL